MKSYMHIYKCVFGILPTFTDHKGRFVVQTALGKLQFLLHSLPGSMQDLAEHSEVWLKLEHIHLNPPPARANGC